MLLNILCVRDAKLEAFARPIFAVTVGQAERAFRDDLAIEPKTEAGKHPEDFSLWLLGKWDDQSGVFDLLPQPRLVCQAQDLLNVN